MKISVCCIVKEDTFYLNMMIKSVIDFADEIIIVDDIVFYNIISKNELLCSNLNNEFKTDKIKYFELEFKNDFGKARKFANDKSTGDYIFFLDADELIHELDYDKIKNVLLECEKDGIDCLNVQYIHFINDFAHIDNSEPIHIGLRRIYKNYKNVEFPNKNHSLPAYEFKKTALCPHIIIWHLGYLRGIEKIRERFARNFAYSEMHTPLQQVFWRDWHYFGMYPMKEIDVRIIPKVIKEAYLMNQGGSSIGL